MKQWMSRLLAFVMVLALLCPAELPALASGLLMNTETGEEVEFSEVQTPQETKIPEEAEETPQPEETPEPESTEAPATAVPPEATALPEATVSPEATASPEVTVTPEATTVPEVTATPETTVEPGSTEIPEGAADPTAQAEFSVEDVTIGVKESAFLPMENVPANVTLRFSSSNSRICTVSAAGVVKGVAKGTAVITVQPSEGESVQCTVTVVAAPSKISISKTSATLGKGQALDLDYSIAQGTSATITWSTSKRSVATVNENGVVTAVGVGSATISVRTHNGKIANCRVTVKKAPGWIKAEPAEMCLGVGQRVEDVFRIESGSYTTLTYRFATGEVTGDASDFVKMENDVLVATAAGTVDVTASTHNGHAATVKVTVLPAPQQIGISAESLTLGVNQQAKLNVTLPEGTAARVEYSSSKTKVVRVDEDGAIKALRTGTAVITVKTHNGIEKKCAVTVKKAPSRIALRDTELTLYPGMTAQPEYTLTSNTMASVTWRSSNADVAEVSAAGVVTAKAVGTTTITVRTHNGRQDTLKLYVYAAPTRLNVAEEAITMGAGQKLGLNIDTDAAARRALKFVSSDAAVAKVSADGTVQAVKAGHAVISVSALNGEMENQVAVTVMAAPSRVTLPETRITMGVGDTYTISPNVPNGSHTCFTYSSSSSRATVTADGVVTAKKVGSATITVKAHNGKKATLKITIRKAPGWIRSEYETLTLGVGQQVSNVFTYEKNTYTDIAYTFAQEGVVRMDGAKLVAAAVGETDVTAATHNGHTACVKVTVLPAPETITLSAEAMDMGISQRAQLNVTLPEGTAAGLTYTSSSTKVVKVSATGELHALRAGTAVITVKTHNGVEKKCSVSVKKAPGKITLADTEKTLYIGMSEKLNYTLPANTIANITWSSSNPAVAEIAADGTLTGRSEGIVTITVRTHNGRKDTLKLYVYPAPTRMELTQTSPMSMGVGQKMEIRPDTDAVHYRMLSFSSSNASVVKISASGQMQAVKAGTATVTVRTLDSRFVETLDITVYAAPRTFSLRQSKVTIGVGETYRIEPVFSANSYAALTYKASNRNVTVDANGVVTARYTGTANVTVTTHNGKKATLKVTVTRQPDSITLSEETMLRDMGETVQLTYQLTTGTMSHVTWTSSNPAVCTVNNAGQVSCVGTGKAVITATTNNGKSDGCEITVVEPAVRLDVVRSISLHVGEIYELEIDAETSSGAAYQGNIVLTPGEGNYVQIVDGNVYGVQKGSTTVTVKASNQQVVVQVTVLSETNDSRRDIIVSSCLAKLGCPYVYANHGPDKFDCSGLVYYGYKQVGITLKYSAYAQGYQEGVQITKEQLLPGDIVCFNTNASDGDLSDHTGIYIGDGKFVHASSSEAKVIISDLTTGYYERTFSWGRRILR